LAWLEHRIRSDSPTTLPDLQPKQASDALLIRYSLPSASLDGAVLSPATYPNLYAFTCLDPADPIGPPHCLSAPGLRPPIHLVPCYLRILDSFSWPSSCWHVQLSCPLPRQLPFLHLHCHNTGAQ
jgi:hypothetical protein